jgi:uncharacterized membrane protein
VFRAEVSGFLQQVDFDSLTKLARERDTQITLHHAPGDFLIEGQIILSAFPPRDADLPQRLRACVTQGSNRTDVQDVTFLSDQLVEVLGRALSAGINDPNTAMLCLNWLRSGLMAFATRPPTEPPRRDDPVLYRRPTFEDMLDRSFDQMRQYVAADRTVTLHSLGILGELAREACRPAMTQACIRQMRKIAASASELQDETAARAEIADALEAALTKGGGKPREDEGTAD